MKTSYKIVLALAIATVMLFTALPCGAVEKEEEDIWREDEPKREHRELELTDEAIGWMMERLAESNPEKVEELAQLREKDPERFNIELREAAREEFGKRFSERKRQRAGRGARQPGADMPFNPRTGQGRMGIRMRERQAEHLEWLEKNYPEEAEKLVELRKKRPELYMRQMALSLRKYGRIAEAAKENPELAEILKEDLELTEKRDKLLREIKGATDDDEKEKLTKKLEKVISSRFDLIVRRKQIRYERLRKRLEELKKQVKQSEGEVEKWKKVKSEKIQERLEGLISRTEKFNWD